MLNVCQLMIALVAELVDGDVAGAGALDVAEPPTTVRAGGPGRDRRQREPSSGSSAVVVSSRLREAWMHRDGPARAGR